MTRNSNLMTDDCTDGHPLRPELPFLTSDLPGIGGTIKTIPADFAVEEIPLYEFSGRGTHVLAYVQKKGITTAEMITRLAKALGIRKYDVGYAGRKDANAITRQWISVEHIDPKRMEKLDTGGLKILDVTRHNNKLKVGHLKGNRFTVRIRNLEIPLKQAERETQRIMEILCRRGVPNYFGQQRFGYRYDSHILGEAIIKGDIREFFNIFLGRPDLDRQEEFIEARTLYEQGDLEAAFYAWHSAFSDHRKALKTLLRNNGDIHKTFGKMDPHYLRLLVCAWQSDIFNDVLAKRLPQVDKLLEGDMAYKHVNRACFRVENPETEQPRCDAFEVSPTGPLPGKRMTVLTGSAGEIENSVLDTIDLTADDLNRLKQYGAGGGRRSLRFRPENTDITSDTDEHGDHLQLRFELPSGCYATVLLREITKQDD